MPHLHLSLQAGSNLILKRMKRRHLRKDVINLCNKLKKFRNNIVFGADIIAGFPTETNEMFADSIRLIDECNLTHLHIFPFSLRESVPAARMPQVSKDIIKSRAKKLRSHGEKKLLRYLNKQIGTTATMLVEQSNLKGSFGKSQHFTKILINEKLPEGSIVNSKIYKIKRNILQAKTI